jgi:hypothetical protein
MKLVSLSGLPLMIVQSIDHFMEQEVLSLFAER